METHSAWHRYVLSRKGDMTSAAFIPLGEAATKRVA